jgi:hypothetical protein
MTWADKIITDKELAGFSEGSPRNPLALRVAALIEHQKRNWPLLREGYESLQKAEVRRINLPGTRGADVVVQLNPKRIRSTAAPVDKASVDARRCFLCPESLPPEEKGIAYGETLIITCNPYPVLDRHLSIIHREHIPQQIEGNVETLLDLARDLGPDYFVLYNGPQCGASAPDHLHLQACSRTLLPIEDDLRRRAESAASERAKEVFILNGCGRSVVVFRGLDARPLAQNISRGLEVLARQTAGSTPAYDGVGPSNGSDVLAEPMVNIIVTNDHLVWTVYLFPRARHRPASFYAEGDERLTISPGAIDMAGVVVMPDAEEFRRVTPEQVGQVFSEVSLGREIVDKVVLKLTV